MGPFIVAAFARSPVILGKWVRNDCIGALKFSPRDSQETFSSSTHTHTDRD